MSIFLPSLSLVSEKVKTDNMLGISIQRVASRRWLPGQALHSQHVIPGQCKYTYVRKPTYRLPKPNDPFMPGLGSGFAFTLKKALETKRKWVRICLGVMQHRPRTSIHDGSLKNSPIPVYIVLLCGARYSQGEGSEPSETVGRREVGDAVGPSSASSSA
jgi:hypothetical protein